MDNTFDLSEIPVRKNSELIKNSFIGDDPLYFIEDERKRAETKWKITGMTGADPADISRRLLASAFFSQTNRKDMSFCYENLDPLIEQWYGKKQSVEYFYNDMKSILANKGSIDSGVINSRAAGALLSGTSQAVKTFAGLPLIATNLVADEICNLPKTIYSNIFGDGSYDGHKDAIANFRANRESLDKALDTSIWDTNAAIKSDWFTTSNGISDWVTNAGLSVLNYVPSLASQIGIGIVMGPAAVCTCFGIEGAAELDAENPDMGIVPKIAYGTAIGLINSVMEKYTIGLVTGKLDSAIAKEGIKKGFLSVLKHIGGISAKEGVGEFLEEVATNCTDILFGRRGSYEEIKNWKASDWYSNIRSNTFESMVVGAVSGIGPGFSNSKTAVQLYQENINFRENARSYVQKLVDSLNKSLDADRPYGESDEITQKSKDAIEFLNVIDDAPNPAIAADTIRDLVLDELNERYKNNEDKIAEKNNEMDMTDEERDTEALKSLERRKRLAIIKETFKRLNPHNPIDTENRVVELSKNYSDVDFFTVRNSSDYPEAVIAAAKKAGYTGSVLPRAFFYNGQVWIDSSRVRPSEVQSVMDHETVGHKGLQSLFNGSDSYNAFLDSVYNSFYNDVEFMNVADLYVGGELDTVEKQRTAAKEFITRQAEKGGFERPAWKDILGSAVFLLKKLRSPGYLMNSGDLARMLSRSYRAVKKTAFDRFMNSGDSNVINAGRINVSGNGDIDSSNTTNSSMDDTFEKSNHNVDFSFVIDGYDPVSLSNKINEVFDLKSKRREIVRFSKMPDILLKIGLPESCIISRADIIRKLDKKHSLSKQQIIDLPKYYSDPVMVLKDGEDYIVLTEMQSISNDGKSKPVMVSLHPIKKENGEIILIASAYSRTAQNENKYILLSSDQDNVLFFDEKKASSINLEERTISTLCNQIRTGFKYTLNHENEKSNQNVDFSLVDDELSSKDLAAIHNLNQDMVLSADKLGGFPMPSIAIVKAKNGYDDFGDISLVFDSSSNAIQRELNKYGNASDELMDDFMNLMDDIGNMNVRYFEAKPYRAIGFDEVVAAVVPGDAKQEVLDVLAKNRIPVFRYDRNNQKSRIKALQTASESSDILFSLSDYSNSTVRDAIDILRPSVGQNLSNDDSFYAAELKKYGMDIDDSDVHVLAVMAMKENAKDARKRYRRALSDWLVNMVPVWSDVISQTKSDDFVIVPSERFIGEEFTGSFIAPEFRKYSLNDGVNFEGKKKTDYLARREASLKKAEGLRSDELASAIARKKGGDAVAIEQKIIDFFRNLKKTDLQRMYKNWKDENYSGDRELEQQAIQEYMKKEEERIQSEAVSILESGNPVVNEEWARENLTLYKELFRQIFGKDPSGLPSQKQSDLMNEAIIERRADIDTIRTANEYIRNRAMDMYRERLRDIRNKVMQSKANAMSLQREALDYAKRYLPAEEMDEFARRIVGLLDYSTSPSGNHPQGRRQEEFRKIMQDILKKSGDVRRDRAVEDIKSMLDSVKLKRNYRGVPISILPSEQANVERIRFISSLDMAALANLVTSNNEELSTLDDMDESMTRRETLLEDNALISMFGNLDRKNPDDVEIAAKTLKEIIYGGKAAFRDKLNQRKNEIDAMRQQAIQYYMDGDTEFSNEQNDNGPNKYWINNMSLPTLMRMGGIRDGWDSTLPGQLYKRIEDATWGEQADLRNLQNDIDEQLAAIGESNSERKANFLKDIRNRGRAINRLNQVQEHTGVFVTEFSRPVYDQNGNDTGISETGRRKTVKTTIPIEDHTGKDGTVKKGARSLLTEYDKRQSVPVREWNESGLPRNYLAKDDMKIPIVELKNILPKEGMNHFDYINRFRDGLTKKLHNHVFKNEVLLSGKSSKKIISESYKSDVSSYVFSSVLANINDLFSNAKLGSSFYDSKKSTNNLLQLHRLFSCFELDGKIYSVKFTVKEHSNPDGTYLYTLSPSEIDVEVKNQDTKKPASMDLEAGTINARGTSRESSNIVKFITLIEKFKLKDDFKFKKIENNGILLDEIAVEFLRQQLADYDAGIASAYEIFNDENDDAAFNRMLEEEKADGKLVVITPDPKEKSVLKELKLSQGAAMQALLTWEQDAFRPGMKWNGWTEESIEQLKNFIDPENLKLAYWMRDYIYRNRKRLDDAVYERFGARMPLNDKYFPGIFLNNGRGRMKEGSLGRGMGTLSVNPGFLVARKFHMLPVDLNANALQTFMDNQMQQIHFLQWDNVLRDIRGVYNNSTVQKIINDKLGRNVSNALLSRFSMLANNGASTSNAASQIVSSLYKNWIPAKISFNVSSLIKQMFGAAAYANCPDVAVSDFLKAFVVDEEYKRFVKLAVSSDFFKSRQGGAMDKDLIYLMNSRGNQNYNPFTSAIMGIAGWATQKGDAIATLSPFGYAIYRNAYNSAIKSGMKESDARQAGLHAWQRATDETQQSGYLKDLNAFQADQGLVRFATMFLSNPIQVMNLEIQAFQEWKRTGSEKSRQAFMRRAVVNHLIVPSLMWAVTEMMRHGFIDWDEYEWEDMLIGWLAGPFEGALIAGKFFIQLANYAADMLVGRKGYTSDVVFDALPIASDLMRDTKIARKVLGEGKFSEKEIVDAIKVSGDILVGAGSASPILGAIGTTLSSLGSQAKRFMRIFERK